MEVPGGLSEGRSCPTSVKVLLHIALLLTCLPAQSQIILSRQVICPVGISGEGSYLIQGTAGQPVDQTFVNDTLTLTQGFQQPDFLSLFAEYAIVWPECDNGDGATILLTNFAGCANEELEILWEGQPSDSVITNVLPGDYELLITSGTACFRQVLVEVPESPNPPCNLGFYNTFTPNNDGENDTWIIENIQFDRFADNSVSIYNRWGGLVWESSNYDNQFIVWEGLHQDGVRLPDGTYYYLVESAGQVFQGFVELMR